MDGSENVSRREQLQALVRVAKFRPLFTAGIIFGGIFAALLEGVGLSFILPIIEIVQASGDPAAEATGVMSVFVTVYQQLGIPLTLGFAVIGVSLILTVRWTITFVVRWLREALMVNYTREIQRKSFEKALNARIEYFDQEGSDDILNAIVTQAEYAGRTIKIVVNFIEQGLMALLYLLVAFALAPSLTLFAVMFLGGFTVLFRRVIKSGYETGDKVADANERIQEAAQAGTQGIRDTKLFQLEDELYGDFVNSINKFSDTSILLRRNEQAINNFYNLLTAISVFILIYLAVTLADLSLGVLGVFLFAMFRLGPKASNMNQQLYRTENNLPHLVRTQKFIDELAQNSEPSGQDELVPEEIRTIQFDNVEFSYAGQQEKALSGVSFEFKKGEFIGFVGQSGAGKSTIASLLTRMYEPDSGEIRANGESIQKMDVQAWRSQISVVRQDPYIFNDTLRYNLTVGNRDVDESELRRICEIARVDEFIEDLPDRYETELGDNGVRLSGGQKQRVALARALIKDSEVLILDEATSDLDTNLEEEVQDAIEDMDSDYAILTIAHRLSTIKNADKIYTVENGQIIETGSHHELVENEGKYAELYAAQSKR